MVEHSVQSLVHDRWICGALDWPGLCLTESFPDRDRTRTHEIPIGPVPDRTSFDSGCLEVQPYCQTTQHMDKYYHKTGRKHVP